MGWPSVIEGNHQHLMRFLSLLLAWLLPLTVAFGESPPLRTDNLDSRLVAAQTAVVPGQQLRVGLWLRHDPEWHTYWLNPGDSGLATRIELELPPGFEAGSIRWPLPERLPAGPLVNFGYSDTVVLPLDITVPAVIDAASVTLRARADWLICKVECIPGDGEYALTLPVAGAAETDARWAADFARAERRQPVRVAGRAAVSFTDETVELRLPADLDPAPDAGWVFFPATAPVVSNTAEPRWLETGDGTALVLPKSDYFVAAPERFEFLLAQGDTGLLCSAVPAAAPAPDAGGRGAAAPGLLVALGLALLGGLALNLMPCVFPVLFLKAAGAIEAGGDRAVLRRHGLFYTAGVVASFLVVAGLLLALRASGEALGWGFQLQSPPFVAALVLLFFVLAMNFAGLFEFGGRLAGAGQRLAQGRGDRAAFFTGVLACLVASPCTAPFMGVALGVALALPAPAALAIFVALGLGLALPILALGWVPGLAQRLPRPGPWMETFRRVLAFPLLLTVAWLLWVYGEQTSVLAMSWLLAALVGVAFGLWLLGARGRWRIPGYVALALSIALPLLRAPEVSTPAAPAAALYEAWSPARLADLRAAGHPVLVNMTAAWCITCLANERVALSSPAFAAALEARGVRYLKGDWTRRDSEITAYLESFGRSGVPLYVFYPGPNRDPVVLPQLLTVEVVQQALATP
jgi:DsbC/DsbD-like thiol-disulfide interchange protein/cytochrome c biogenesis protein CcdA